MTDEQIAELVERYGPDPSAVGPVDGAEDDYGDLLCDVWALLGGDEHLGLWQHFQDVAGASRASTMAAWVAELEAVTTIYGGGTP